MLVDSRRLVICHMINWQHCDDCEWEILAKVSVVRENFIAWYFKRDRRASPRWVTTLLGGKTWIHISKLRNLWQNSSWWRWMRKNFVYHSSLPVCNAAKSTLKSINFFNFMTIFYFFFILYSSGLEWLSTRRIHATWSKRDRKWKIFTLFYKNL